MRWRNRYRGYLRKQEASQLTVALVTSIQFIVVDTAGDSTSTPDDLNEIV